MLELEACLERYGQDRHARYWLGQRPAVRTKVLPRAIASMVGYPTSGSAWIDEPRFVQIERPAAAQVLAWVATESQAYGRWTPRESYRQEAMSALSGFGDNAVFLTNVAEWTPGARAFSAQLSNATFDAGLIAYDSDNAFIFWAEDED